MKEVSASEIFEKLEDKLRAHFGVMGRAATDTQVFCACAELVRESMSRELAAKSSQEGRQVHYLSMEFLLGRSLEKNAYNLGVLEPLCRALEDMGREPAEIFEREPDAGLGNGGLGRLAACYMDSCATLGLPVTGYSICYENGMFRQSIERGQQRELADDWLAVGESWLVSQHDDAVEVRFGGRVEQSWDHGGRYRAELKEYQSVIALPRDMLISGYKGGRVCRLRLWDARSPSQLDMSLFTSGKYAESMESRTLAEVITKVLYPADDHDEGRTLRLKQQYFFVSATAQSIVREHKRRFGSVHGFEKMNVIQINDTHPTLIIPELMRIFLDDEGMDWDEAWKIVTESTAYTNHTIMQEALEVWPQELVSRMLPRIWELIVEIDRRWGEWLRREMGGAEEKVLPNLIINGDVVHMANICQAACFRINGVSALHGSILRTKLFREVYEKRPECYTFVTNGIDHRRWLSQCNPGLAGLISSLIGEGWLRNAGELERLRGFETDFLLALGVDQIDDRLRLRQTQLAVQKGAAGKLARSRHLRPGAQRALQHQLRQQNAAVTADFHRILAGIRARRAEHHRHAVVDAPPVRVNGAVNHFIGREAFQLPFSERTEHLRAHPDGLLSRYADHRNASAAVRRGYCGYGRMNHFCCLLCWIFCLYYTPSAP